MAAAVVTAAQRCDKKQHVGTSADTQTVRLIQCEKWNLKEKWQEITRRKRSQNTFQLPHEFCRRILTEHYPVARWGDETRSPKYIEKNKPLPKPCSVIRIFNCWIRSCSWKNVFMSFQNHTSRAGQKGCCPPSYYNGCLPNRTLHIVLQ